ANASYITNSGYAQLQSSLSQVLQGLSNTASTRYDSNSQFGGKATYRVAPAYAIAQTGTVFRASVGTSFNPPTLDELYDSYGGSFLANPNLVPETSLGWDAGAEQALLDKRVDIGATYFHNDIKNLITTNSTGTSLINVGKATTYGVESFVSYKPWDPLTLRVDYTYTMAMNDTASMELPRRPKNKASFNAAWHVTDRATVTGTVLYVGAWRDNDRAFTPNFVGSPYTIINIAGSYDLGHGVTAFARIDNLTNRIYQNPIGYQHQGLGVFGGVSVALDTANWLGKD
ncbi:MAG TPA: TonB-dependent receptor, partial [Stellaceae bacterium]|nr:TonB-dependent receptor [Stellaceae bacterium]